MAFLHKLYFKLPIWSQNLGVSAYAWYRDKFFRKNKYYSEAVKLVEKINNSTQEEIEEWQLKQLNWIVNYAIQNTGFYKDFYGMDKVHFKSFDDFKQLPTIDKQIVRENWGKFQVDIKDKVFKTHTSGTTGSSLQLRISAKTTAVERAGFYFSRAVAGYKKGDKVASFIGRKIMNQSENTPPFWRYNSYDKQLIFSNWHVSDESLPHYVERFNSFKPDYVNGYPSFLYLFSEFILRNNMKVHSPKGVFTGSETLLDYQRETIEEAFGSKIFDHYGTAENLIVAHQCENGNYHIREELGYLEVVNNQVCGTTFHNTAFPLIRYNIGDASNISLNNCNCNNSGRILNNLQGRIEDIIISKSGRKYGRLYHIFKDANNVKEAQIIQESVENLIINVVPQNNENYDLSTLKASVIEKLGNDFEIKFQILKEIPRTKSGKFRFVISKLKKY